MSDDIEKLLRAGGGGGGDADRAARRFAAAALEQGLVDVAYAKVDSPIGQLLTASTDRGLVNISFLGFRDEDEVLQRLASSLSPRVLEAPAKLDTVRRELDEYFEGRRQRFDVPLDLSLLTPFQGKVLRATSDIPYGAHASYGEVAALAGNPKAFRAAGTALGRNPIPIIIPCHRVWAAQGKLGGYTGGLERKRTLLELEGSLQPELG